MHWIDTDHHKIQSGENRAKFFVRANEDEIFFGFSIGEPNDDTESSKNWESLMHWLEHDDNQETMHAIALSNGLTIYDRNRPESPELVPNESGWQVDNKQKEKTAAKINDFISSLTADGIVSLEVAKSLNKEASLASGKEIATEIAELFSQLLPLYRASWVSVR
jgi:hypothetical protein